LKKIYNLENSKIEELKDSVHNFLVFEGVSNKLEIDIINETQPQTDDNLSEDEIIEDEPQTKKRKLNDTAKNNKQLKKKKRK